jgi:hypothetical protein
MLGTTAWNYIGNEAKRDSVEITNTAKLTNSTHEVQTK